MKKKWFIGVDISKKTLDVAIYTGSPKGVSSENHLEVSNDPGGFKKLTAWFKRRKMKCSELLICMEHTGIYGFDFCLFLEENHMDYNMSSPVHVSRSLGFKRGKNDRIDSFRLSWYCYTFRDSLPLHQMKESTVIGLRDLMNEHKLYVRQLSTHKAYLTEHQKRSSSPAYERSSASKLYFEKQIAAIEKQLEELICSDQAFYTNYKLLTSIKGIGIINALNAIVLTNNFNSFQNARQYACYLGIAPFEHESGSSIRGRTRVSRAGAKQQKADLSQAAKSAVNCDREMRMYYERKIKEGKEYGTVMNAIKFKLIGRMFAVVNRGTPWVDIKAFAN